VQSRPSHRASGQLRLFNSRAELHTDRNATLPHLLDASFGLSHAGLRHRPS
jgi:hypothetical protein